VAAEFINISACF